MTPGYGFIFFTAHPPHQGNARSEYEGASRNVMTEANAQESGDSERFETLLNPSEHREITMKDKNEKEIIGYYTEDGDIYCVDCINKNIKIMNEIDKAIRAEDLEESLLFCEGCEKEIK